MKDLDPAHLVILGSGERFGETRRVAPEAGSALCQSCPKAAWPSARKYSEVMGRMMVTRFSERMASSSKKACGEHLRALLNLGHQRGVLDKEGRDIELTGLILEVGFHRVHRKAINPDDGRDQGAPNVLADGLKWPSKLIHDPP